MRSPAHVLPVALGRRRLIVGGVVAVVATPPITVALAVPSSAAPDAAARPAVHGPTSDSLRGVGEQIDPNLGEKVYVDLHPTGYYPSAATVTGAVFTATVVDDSTSTPVRTDGEGAADTAADQPADDTDSPPSCTMDPSNDASDTSPGAEQCEIEELEFDATYNVHEQVTPVGFATAPDQQVTTFLPDNFPVPGESNSAFSSRIAIDDPLFQTLTFANRGLWRPVILTKTGSGGAVLPGAGFHLCAASSASNPQPLTTGPSCPTAFPYDLGLQTTDASGRAEWPYALPGSFVLVETAAPTGYAADAPLPVTFGISQVDADPVNVTEADALLPTPAPSSTPSPTPAAASPTPSPTPVVVVTPHKTVKHKVKTAVKPASKTRTIAQPTRPLAFTGVRDLEPLTLLGIGLILAGAGTSAIGRRRSH